MGIDVTSEVAIARPREDVARYAMDATNDPVWIGGISEAEVLGGGPVAVGTRVRRVARFMGKRIEYVNEVVALEPGSRLEMRSVKSPFPMRVTYGFEDVPGGTRARIRVEGEPGRFYRIGNLVAPGVRRSITRDLRNLKRITEGGSAAPGERP